MHLSSPDELKLKIREMWMFLLSWNWASFISLVMLVWCHIISYTSNTFFFITNRKDVRKSRQLVWKLHYGSYGRAYERWIIYFIQWNIFFCACFIHPVIDLSILYICTHLRIHRFPEDRRGVTFSCNWDCQHGVRWLYHHDTSPASMDM